MLRHCRRLVVKKLVQHVASRLSALILARSTFVKSDQMEISSYVDELSVVG